jgi:predicted transcriptional regulator
MGEFLPSREIKKRKKYNILRFIQDYVEEGISHNNLAYGIGIDRKNLRPYLEELINEGFVRRDDGKFGKYYPTTKSVDRNFLSEAYGKGLRAICFRKRSLILPDIRSIYPGVSNRLVTTKFSANSDTEASIYEFSNRIGALICYTLIQALNVKNHLIKNKGRKIRRRGEIVENYMSRFEIAERWAKKVMANLFVFPLLFNFDKIACGLDDGPDSEIQAFARLYPRVYYELNSLWQDLPRRVEYNRKHEEYLLMNRQIQRKCKHQFKPLEFYLGLDRDDMKHCHRCHATRYI